MFARFAEHLAWDDPQGWSIVKQGWFANDLSNEHIPTSNLSNIDVINRGPVISVLEMLMGDSMTYNFPDHLLFIRGSN